MGLTGTTSWTSGTKSNGTLTRYKSDGSTVSTIENQGQSFFLLVWAGGLQNYNKVIFTVTTDAAGCSSLSFTCGKKYSGTSGPPKQYWKIMTKKSLSTSGSTEAVKTSGGWAGTMSDVKMLPNTTYYILFWSTYGSDSGHLNGLTGTMTITGSGTYGEPGEIEAPDEVDFNEAIDMSYGSATDGGKYTVSVQVGESDVEWAADTDYAEGDILQYNGLLY